MLAVIAGFVVVGSVVLSFQSARRQVIFTRAGPEAQSSEQELTPIDVQSDLEDESVYKIEVKYRDGDLEARVFGTSSADLIRQGKIDSVRLPNEVTISPTSEGIELEHGGAKSVTTFPISYNKVTDQIVIEAGGESHYLRILPDRAMEIGKKEINGDIKHMEIVGLQKSLAGDNLAFRVWGQKSRYVLGLIPVETTIETAVGAQSGVILETTEPWWFKFLP